MSLNNIANPAVILTAFSDLMSKNSDTISNIIDSLIDSLINPEDLSIAAVQSFTNKFPGGVSFQLSDIGNFQLASDGIEIVWIDYNGTRLGPLVSPTDFDEEERPINYKLFSDAYDTAGNVYDVHSLFGMLSDNVATNQCIANAITLVRDGAASNLSDILNALPGYGVKVTDTARSVLNNMSQYTSGFSQTLGLLDFVRSTYTSLTTATASTSEGKIIFNVDRNFTIKSAFTIGWGEVFSNLTQVAGAIIAFAVNPVIGAVITGTGFLISKISDLYENKTEGKLNPMSLNRAFDATLMTIPRFVAQDHSYVKDHIAGLGLISYYMSGAMVHFAQNTTADRTISMTIVPELGVAAPYKLNSSSVYEKTSACPDALNISYTSEANPTFTISWSDQSNRLMQFSSMYGESPVAITEAIQQSCLSLAYTIYNLTGILSTNSFTVTNNWWASFKQAIPINTLSTCTDIELIQYLNTIAGVLMVIGTGQVYKTQRTMIGEDSVKWAYQPNPVGYYDFDSIISWQMISEIIEYLQIGLSRHSVYSGIDAVLDTFNNSVVRLDNVINLEAYYKVFFCEPPIVSKYSVALLIITVAASVAIIAASVVLAKKALQNAVLPRMTRRYDQINAKRVEMQTLDYLNNTSKKQQLADQSLLLKQTRRYNFLAQCLGLSTISYTTGWENLDGRSSLFNSMSMNSDSTSLLDRVSNLVQNDSESACDNSINFDNIIYKAITGQNLSND